METQEQDHAHGPKFAGQGSLDELLPWVYEELHTLAVRQLLSERRGHTLCPTELVSEAYLRFVRSGMPELQDRAHFVAIAARVMRQVLVDHARRRCAAKRGLGQRPDTLDEGPAVREPVDDLLAVEEALTALAAMDARKARVIELHHFGGLSQPEIASVLEVHVNTVARDLRFAEAWLHRHMTAG